MDMSLVVQNQVCALRESLQAGNAVWVDEAALEHRFAGVSIALNRDRNLFIGVHRKRFKAGIVFPVCDGRFSSCHWYSSITPVILAPISLVQHFVRHLVRCAQCLHRWRASALKFDLGALVTIFAWRLILPLKMQYCGTSGAVSIASTCQRSCKLLHYLGILRLPGEHLFHGTSHFLEVTITLDWVDKL